MKKTMRLRFAHGLKAVREKAGQDQTKFSESIGVRRWIVQGIEGVGTAVQEVAVEHYLTVLVACPDILGYLNTDPPPEYALEPEHAGHPGGSKLSGRGEDAILRALGQIQRRLDKLEGRAA